MENTCVQCKNENNVNTTNNRLVTESCGHVKCMGCLLKETSGCVACKQQNKAEVCQNNGISEKVQKKTQYINIVKGNDEIGQYTQCTICKRKLRNRWQLAYHEHCMKSKTYLCTVPDCGKGFMKYSHYVYHMKVHNNEKSFVCAICEAGFYAKSNLKRHMLRHSNERKYVCPDCKKTFNNTSMWKQHMLTHSNIKPYECKYCNRRMRDRSNYYKHIAAHQGKRPNKTENKSNSVKFQCPHCPRTFNHKKDIQRHSAVHLELKCFRCKICVNKQFRRKDNLDRHIRNYHPDYDSVEIGEVIPSANDERIKLAHTTKQQIIKLNVNNEHKDAEKEKTILENLNPLPPLTQDVIETHLGETDNVQSEAIPVTNHVNSIEIDKSYIIEANTARESVIVAQNPDKCRKDDDEQIGYVHKIRKANRWLANGKTTYCKELQLPPIDEMKISQLETIRNIDVGSPPRNTSVYQKILADEEAKTAGQNLWKRKLKLNIQESNS